MRVILSRFAVKNVLINAMIRMPMSLTTAEDIQAIVSFKVKLRTR